MAIGWFTGNALAGNNFRIGFSDSVTATEPVVGIGNLNRVELAKIFVFTVTFGMFNKMIPLIYQFFLAI